MSSGMMNLGMGFTPQRNDSQVVTSPLSDGDYASWLTQWQSRYQNALDGPRYVPTLAEHQAQIQSQLDITFGQGVGASAFNAGDGNAWESIIGSTPAFGPDWLTRSMGYNPEGGGGYMSDPGNPVALQAQKDQIDQQRQAAVVNQQAYNQQTGGGFSGGILNDSYSQPFGNTITGMPAASSGFTSGMMGGGNSAATPSTGLTPFGAGGASTSQQTASPQGWGGPFSTKNPWSLS